MSNATTPWLSPYAIERADHVRRTIRRLAVDHDVDDAHIARSLGYTPTRFAKLMEMGERAGVHLRDVLVLDRVLGGGDALLEQLAKAAGYRLVRDAAPVPGSPDGDVLEPARLAVAEAAQILARVAQLFGRGMSPGDARELGEGLDRARRHLNRLEAEVGMRVVPDLPRARSSR